MRIQKTLIDSGIISLVISPGRNQTDVNELEIDIENSNLFSNVMSNLFEIRQNFILSLKNLCNRLFKKR